MIHDDETQIIQDILAGSQSAFTTLYDRYQSYVRRIVFGIVSPDDVDDVVQMTFLKVYQKLDTFQGDAKLRTWMHSIAVNIALMHRRASLSRGLGKAVSLDETYDDGQGGVAHMLELSYDDTTADANGARALVHKAMDTLAMKDQFILNYILEGYTIAEIALLIKGSIAKAKSDMFRARVRLRKAVLLLTETGVGEVELEEVA